MASPTSARAASEAMREECAKLAEMPNEWIGGPQRLAAAIRALPLAPEAGTAPQLPPTAGVRACGDALPIPEAVGAHQEAERGVVEAAQQWARGEQTHFADVDRLVAACARLAALRSAATPDPREEPR